MTDSQETGLVKYDTMVRAIVEAHSADEVKAIRDEARLRQLLAQQQNNYESARLVATIRTRAERRLGQIFKAMPKTPGSRSDLVPDNLVPRGNRFNKTRQLEDLGVSRKQAAQAELLAAIPEDEFEHTLASYEDSNEIPTPGGVIKRHNGTKTVQREAALPHEVTEFMELLRAVANTDTEAIGRCNDMVALNDIRGLMRDAEAVLRRIKESLI